MSYIEKEKIVLEIASLKYNLDDSKLIKIIQSWFGEYYHAHYRQSIEKLVNSINNYLD